MDFQANSNNWPAVNYSGVEPNAAAANAEFGSDGINAWNILSVPGYSPYANNPAFNNLIDSLGNSTGISISFTGAVTAAADQPINSNGTNALQNDYFLTFSGNTVGYTITGLAANTMVDFYNYAPSFTLDGRSIILTANGTTIDVPAGIQGGVLTSVMSDASGSISGTFNAAGYEGDWSGFQLAYSSDVPEPASWAMMIAGFGMVCAAMRRQKIAVGYSSRSLLGA